MKTDEWLIKLVKAVGPEEAGEWLVEPQSELEGRTPLEAIRDGDRQEVSDLVDEWF